MAKFDVTRDDNEEITEIVYHSSDCGISKFIDKTTDGRVFINSYDSNKEDASQIIQDKRHAQNLIKALNKAIELGWLK